MIENVCIIVCKGTTHMCSQGFDQKAWTTFFCPKIHEYYWDRLSPILNGIWHKSNILKSLGIYKGTYLSSQKKSFKVQTNYSRTTNIKRKNSLKGSYILIPISFNELKMWNILKYGSLDHHISRIINIIHFVHTCIVKQD